MSPAQRSNGPRLQAAADIEPAPTSAVGSGLRVQDRQPFFERALRWGRAHGVIDDARLAAMKQEAAKGIVQIARYFGSEYLRPELELARVRLVNLISVHLMQATGGDERQAAQLLRDHTLLSRSKAGSDFLKALIVMPQGTHFGMNERGAFAERHIPLLARWTLADYSSIQTEFQQRQRAAQVIDAALWFAKRMDVSHEELVEFGAEADAVIRTGLLACASGHLQAPDWSTLNSMVQALARRAKTQPPRTLVLPEALPAALRPVVAPVLDSVLVDWPRLGAAVGHGKLRQLLDQTPAFMGRYFWLEDTLAEVDAVDRQRSAHWDKITGGHYDDATLLTLMLCVAAGQTPKAVLTERAAATLVRKLRKLGQLDGDAVRAFVADHAPVEHQPDILRLWTDFEDEARRTLCDAPDPRLLDALALLRRECNLKA
ncbi:MAG: hypothetical protein OHK0048_00140 [Rhodoferax sp.]